MKPLFLIILLLLLLTGASSGCSTSQTIYDFNPPELVYQHPLPIFPRMTGIAPMRIMLEIYVTKDGTVGDVQMTNGSGILAWDSAAISAIRRWKYIPARSDGKPFNIWLHQVAIIRFAEPEYRTLAEIICTTYEEADSAFLLLGRGMDFSTIAMRYSIAESRDRNGEIGTVNIQVYPQGVKAILSKLEKGQYTRPTKFGDHYAIFKRLSD
ncbi:MAG: TonB family protein [Bacteroidota bacterium]|jgi:protein TonB